MAVRLKIADTYKRKVKIELPGDGLKPQACEITVIYRDIDPAELETEKEKLSRFIRNLTGMLESLKKGEQDPEQIAQAQKDLEEADSVKAKIDSILVGVEGLEVIGADDQPLEGTALLDFVKRYPRIKDPILKQYADENETGEETAALGNLLKSARRGRG